MTGPGSDRADGRPDPDWDGPRQPWLLNGDCRGRRHRTLLLEITTRAVFSIARERSAVSRR